jgi:hypothetical protein
MTSPLSRRIDPRISLAVSMHDQPGVFALLIGSGTSTGAGIPTGWGVIKDLVAKAAAAAREGLPENPTDDHIEQWWKKHGDDNDLGYSNLLESLGSTPAARSALLSRYFEPSADERAEGLKVPGKAHQAIAELARRGSVRVILTTNFDDLIERALEAASVPHQVIASDAAVEARRPLVHAGCTVVKIHGDYRSLNQKNTLGELSQYSPEMRGLLNEIFEDYGLVINGWSADWDHALVDGLRGRRSRRYPLYWSTMRSLGSTAASLAEQHGAGVIQDVTADEFFPDLIHRLEALDALSSPPLTEEMAIARLKKLLPYRESYIEIRDIINEEIERVQQVIHRRGYVFPESEVDDKPMAYQESCIELRATSRVLVRLVATGVMLDRDRIHTELWVWAVQRLLKARSLESGPYNQNWVKLSHYPALLLLRSIAMIAVTHDREDVFVRAAMEPTWRHPAVDRDLQALLALQDAYVIDPELAKAMPRWGGQRWLYPASELVSADLEDLLADLIGDSSEVEVATRRTEYRMAMALQFLFAGQARPCGGRYAGERAWNYSTRTNIWEDDFRKFGDRQAWGWASVPEGEIDAFDAKLTQLAEALRSFDRWG